jgi:hypothetical protein
MSTSPKRFRYLRRILLFAVAALVVGLGYYWWNLRGPVPATEIYAGVTYGCEQLTANVEGDGLMHWVQVDLAEPGIELFVTPLDPDAVAQGWQYRLQFVGAAAHEWQLAAVINGTLFTPDSMWVPLPGDLARGVETVVADHHVNHVWEHTYLLWFDDDLVPTLESSKPPKEEVLKKARWGIGGQAVGLKDGRVWPGTPAQPRDARTAVGIDADRRLLFLAVFESASTRRALEQLAALGAKDGMLLDGGDSTSMALGAQAAGVRSGVVLGSWRPVATHFGVRAKPKLGKPATGAQNP